MKTSLAFVLLLVAAALAGCATAVMSGAADGDRADSQATTDARLVREIRTLVYRDPLLGDDRIQVHSREGVVTFSGVVDDRQHLDRATQIAHSVEGVRGVNLELRIKSSQ